MSLFEVRVETIDKVIPHDNAERLDIATLVDCAYNFVVGKNQYKPGDQCVYFPLDAIIPDNVAEAIGLLGKLSGKNKNRVKTVKLRGVVSAGVVATVECIETLLGRKISVGEDLKDALGVVKFEPEERVSGGPNQPKVNLKPLPPEVSKYDIENAERMKKLLIHLFDTPVSVTEKLEGCHCAILIRNDSVTICSRNCTVSTEEETVYSLAVEKLKPQIENIQKNLLNGDTLTLRGEVIGPKIQGNIYNLTKIRFVCFDMEVNSKYRHTELMQEFCENYGIETVPELFNGVLNDWLKATEETVSDRIKQLSTFNSTLNPETLAEGIVIKPLIEQHDSKYGRVIIKQRSPEYLASQK